MRIRIKYFTDKIEKLDYIAGKSDWIDLRAAEEVELKKGEFALIPLGWPWSFRGDTRPTLFRGAAPLKTLELSRRTIWECSMRLTAVTMTSGFSRLTP